MSYKRCLGTGAVMPLLGLLFAHSGSAYAASVGIWIICNFGTLAVVALIILAMTKFFSEETSVPVMAFLEPIALAWATVITQPSLLNLATPSEPEATLFMLIGLVISSWIAIRMLHGIEGKYDSAFG